MQLIRSRKLRALQLAYGCPWWEVATKAAAAPLSQGEIARRWTADVQAVAPGTTFIQQEVGRMIRKAVALQLEMAPDKVRHLVEQPIAEQSLAEVA